jgi:hypothetical protein
VESLIKPSRLVIAVIIISAAGIFLRFFNFDTYFIFVGFRFHISFILPLLIIFRKGQLKFIKQLFVDPHHKRTVLPLLWILLPLIIVAGILFLFKKIDIGDPDYFYEFGLSSIVDYPIYLLWNFPQLFCFFIFLALAATAFQKSFFAMSVITFFLFAFEFIPKNVRTIDYSGIASLLLISVSIGLLIKYFQNIYWFTIVIFSIFWLYFLSFGSSSEEIIHLLFASQYSSWDGFLEVNKSFVLYLLPAQLTLTFLTILVSSSFRKKGSTPSF